METHNEATVQVASSESPPEIRRDAEYWLEDGTVILVARGVEFRVYKGVLSTHSPVFADMFSLPQPDQSPSQCPVVHLDDSPEDLRYVLRALLPGTNQR